MELASSNQNVPERHFLCFRCQLEEPTTTHVLHLSLVLRLLFDVIPFTLARAVVWTVSLFGGPMNDHCLAFDHIVHGHSQIGLADDVAAACL
jgi:hypothetical protein